jgi:Spherulation-specific family 4
MATQPSGMLIPAYVYPHSDEMGNPVDWQVLLDVGRTMMLDGLIVVANHEDGHFVEKDSDYEISINALRDICTPVLGYVHDCYNGTKNDGICTTYEATNVIVDVRKWFSTYDVAGIFIDQVGSRDIEIDVQRAESLVQQVHNLRSDAIVVLNTGSVPSETFMRRTDPAIVVIREAPIADYEAFPPSDDEYLWLRNRADGEDAGIAARRLAIIAHTAPNQAHVDSLIAKAEQYQIRWIHVQHALEDDGTAITGPVYDPFSVHLSYIAERINKCARMGCLIPFGALGCRFVNYLLCYMLQKRNAGLDVLRRLRRGD